MARRLVRFFGIPCKSPSGSKLIKSLRVFDNFFHFDAARISIPIPGSSLPLVSTQLPVQSPPRQIASRRSEQYRSPSSVALFVPALPKSHPQLKTNNLFRVRVLQIWAYALSVEAEDIITSVDDSYGVNCIGNIPRHRRCKLGLFSTLWSS